MGLPNFMELILLRVWDMADVTPYSVLEWLSAQTTKNSAIASWVIEGMHLWVEKFLIANMNQSVRSGNIIHLKKKSGLYYNDLAE